MKHQFELDEKKSREFKILLIKKGKTQQQYLKSLIERELKEENSEKSQ